MRLTYFSFPKLYGGHNITHQPLPNLFNMHIHDKLEVVYILQGNVTFQVEGTVYPMDSGDLIISRMAETHNMIDKPNFPVYERMVFHIDPVLLQETLCGRLLKPFMDRPIGTMNYYSAQELPGTMIQACLQQLLHGSEKRNEMQAFSYLLPILQAIYDAYLQKTTVIADEPLPVASEVIAYINQHLYELEGVHELENHFFLSTSQINRIFRSFAGSSVWNYIKLKRLFAARELIQNGILPHKAATTCGYQDYSSFFRAYKKQFGNTPRDDLCK